LKGILKDQESNSSDEIEGAITRIDDDVLQNWMGLLAWVVENGGENAGKT
jgi:hypothetical protein